MSKLTHFFLLWLLSLFCSSGLSNAADCSAVQCPKMQECPEGTTEAPRDIDDEDCCKAPECLPNCNQETCPELSCNSNEYKGILTGDCCQSCIPKLINDPYPLCDNGVEFTDSINPCLKCSCFHGEVSCLDTSGECSELPANCTNVVKADGQCCPICEDENEPSSSPPTVESCNQGTCPELSCNSSEYKGILTGDCCQSCIPKLINDPYPLCDNGVEFTDPINPCLKCSCFHGEVSCLDTSGECSELPANCTNVVKADGQCCPICEDENEPSSSPPTVESCNQGTCPELSCNSNEYKGILTGDCCQSCIPKLINDPYPLCDNGVEFTDSINPCLKCSCFHGEVSCLDTSGECSELPANCTNVVKADGQCCPICEDENEPSSSPPTVESCNQGTCPELSCNSSEYKGILTGDCCQSCIPKLINDPYPLCDNGVEFTDPINPCLKCSCFHGEVSCLDTSGECSELPANCTNVVKADGQCCPICEDENEPSSSPPTVESCNQGTCPELSCNSNEYKGILTGDCCQSCIPKLINDPYPLCDNGVEFTDPINPCLKCSCFHGEVSCLDTSGECSELPANCTNVVKADGQCCPICEDENEPSSSPPTVESCNQGTCPELSCNSNEYKGILTGDCCQSCIPKLINDPYPLCDNGVEFTDSINPCLKCSCFHGEVSCLDTSGECSELPANCTNVVKADGQCCPICEDENEPSSSPPTVESCNQGTCPELSCNSSEYKGILTGDCCQSCIPKLINDPYPLCDNGVEFTDPINPCLKCSCFHGEVSCLDTSGECSELPANCTNVVKADGQCCPICEDENEPSSSPPTVESCNQGTCPELSCNSSEYKGILTGDCCQSCIPKLINDPYPLCDNGVEFTDTINPCLKCSCFHGEVSCLDTSGECSELPANCTNVVKADGQCCPICEDENEPSSSPPTVESCNQGTCPELSCSSNEYKGILTGDCCQSCIPKLINDPYPLCDNGVEFTDPINPCLKCSCFHGEVSCLDTSGECSELPANCTNVVKADGQCCPTCEDESEPSSSPPTVESCNQGTCPELSCNSSEYKGILTGDCCQSCIPKLINDPYPLCDSGVEFTDTINPCLKCSCFHGEVSCLDTSGECSELPANCTNVVKADGQCCPICEDENEPSSSPPTVESCNQGTCPELSCSSNEYKGILTGDCCQSCIPKLINDPYPLCDNGVEFTDPINPCLKCSCFHGEVSCLDTSGECSELPANCTNVVNMEGQCCPACEEVQPHLSLCQIEGSYVNPNDPCQNCSCHDGNTSCFNFRETCNLLPANCEDVTDHIKECCSCLDGNSLTVITEDQTNNIAEPVVAQLERKNPLDTPIDSFEITTSQDYLSEHDPSRTFFLVCMGIGFLIILAVAAIATATIIKCYMNSRAQKKEAINNTINV